MLGLRFIGLRPIINTIGTLTCYFTIDIDLRNYVRVSFNGVRISADDVQMVQVVEMLRIPAAATMY